MSNSLPFITEKYTHEIISLELARKWLRMDIDGYEGEDDVIVESINSAIDRVEEICNLSLGISTYTWNTACFPCRIKDIFYVKNITSARHYDGSGYVLIENTNYELVQVGKRESELLWSESFKTDSTRFQVIFTAGFEPGKVPPQLLRAIRAMIAEDFDSREDSVSEKRTLSDKLMEPYRIGYAG